MKTKTGTKRMFINYLLLLVGFQVIFLHSYIQAQQVNKFQVLQNLFDKKTYTIEDTFTREKKQTHIGKPIAIIGDIQPCIDTFYKMMNQRGVDSVKKRHSRFSWRKAQLITLSETFTGDTLMNWFVDIANKNPPADTAMPIGRNLIVKLVYAVYTKNFLVNNNMDSSQMVNKLGRMTTFVVVYKSTKRDNTKLNEWLFSPDDVIPVGGFDFGDLQP